MLKQSLPIALERMQRRLTSVDDLWTSPEPVRRHGRWGRLNIHTMPRIYSPVLDDRQAAADTMDGVLGSGWSQGWSPGWSPG